jgi:hypothetical protein
MSEQTAGILPKATVQFTLHVHLDDGTTKDIQCVGQIHAEPRLKLVVPEPQPQTELVWSKKE